MANGTRKPISEVEEGDYVYATDPETGESGPREVIATLPHTDQLLTLRLSSGEVVTTEDHRYWNETDQAWQESQDLDAGDRLLTADGGEVLVEGLDRSTVHTAAAYDLTIEDLRTFYVGAGDESVLVHNCSDEAYEMARHAIEGHADDFWTTDLDEIGDYLDEVMSRPGYEVGGKTYWWDDERGMVVIRDPGAYHGGTAFRPAEGYDYFRSLIDE